MCAVNDILVDGLPSILRTMTEHTAIERQSFDEIRTLSCRPRHGPFFGQGCPHQVANLVRASPSPNLQEVLICKGCPHTAAEMARG